MKAPVAITLFMIIAVVINYSHANAQHSEWYLPTHNLRFSPQSATLPIAVQQELDTLKIHMQANPDFKVVIEGCCGYSKLNKQLNWDRVQVIISYMVHNIDRSRFIFKYQGAPLDNTVRYRQPYDGEEGPCYLPPPYPELSKLSRRLINEKR